MNEVTDEWVTKADNDFYSADRLLHSGDVPLIDTACFHCHQCAEKYLKAYLTAHLIRFERTHVLMDLLRNQRRGINHAQRPGHPLRADALDFTPYVETFDPLLPPPNPTWSFLC